MAAGAAATAAAATAGAGASAGASAGAQMLNARAMGLERSLERVFVLLCRSSILAKLLR